jgi:hypothetical protein
MYSIPLSRASAIALIIGPVLGFMIQPIAAQPTSQPVPGRDTTTVPGPGLGSDTAAPPLGTSQPAPGAEYPNPLLTENLAKLRGTDVRGGDDKKVGDIETALMKPDSKQVDRVVVDVGGILGLGTHRIALSIDDLSWDPKTGVFRVSKTQDELKQMPEWQEPTATPSPTVTPDNTTRSTGQKGAQ